VYAQLDAMRHTGKGDFQVAYTTVFDRIVNGLLQDSERTERDFVRERWQAPSPSHCGRSLLEVYCDFIYESLSPLIVTSISHAWKF